MLFSRKTEGRVVITLEIQSSVTRGSLVWLRTGAQPMILLTDIRDIPYKKSGLDSAYLIKATMSALSETIDSSLKNFHQLRSNAEYVGMPDKIAEVHYVLSSPWVTSQARTLSLSFEKDTTISAERMSAILAKERSTLLSGDGHSLEVMEEKIFDVRLNGYSISEWAKKQARELEISYAVTACGSDSLKRFREACRQANVGHHIYFHSSLLLQYVGLRVLMPTRDSYDLIHIHGELTDTVVVDHGSCVFFGSYPVGTNTLIRQIADDTKSDIATADSLVDLYSSGHLDAEHARSTAPIMDAAIAAWNAGFDSLFKDNPITGALPQNTIIGARNHEDFFVKGFKAGHVQTKPEILSIDQILPLVSFGTNTERFRIVAIYVLAIHSLDGRSS